MRLSKDSEINGKSMFTKSQDEVRDHLYCKLAKVKLDFEKYVILCKVLRKEMQKKIKFDLNKVSMMADKIVEEYKQFYGNTNYEYQTRLRGLMKSIIVLNTFFRRNDMTLYEVCEEDYDTFDDVFRRLTHDHFELMGMKKEKDGQMKFHDPNEVQKDEVEKKDTTVINK
jgi:hypothetical protein